MEAGDKAGTFSKREIRLIRNCRAHSANDPAGLPGHNLILIIAKMADMLEIADEVEVKPQDNKTTRSLKMRMPDKTELFNLLTIIAALILGGGSSLEKIPEGVPEWAWPILVFVAFVVNMVSRDQTKSQRAFSESLLNKSKPASEDENKEVLYTVYPGEGDFIHVANILGTDPKDLENAYRKLENLGAEDDPAPSFLDRGKVKADSLSASEALYGFMGWLTSRKKEITISSRHDSAEPANLVSAFCEINNLRGPRSDWRNRLTHPTHDYADLLDDIEIVGDSSAGRE